MVNGRRRPSAAGLALSLAAIAAVTATFRLWLHLSNPSTAARDRAREAIARRDELARLFDLSRDVLLTTDSREAIAQLARFVSRRFALDFVAICLPRDVEWDVFEAGALGVHLGADQ